MENSNLNDYFENLDKYSLLDIKKTIIELTNNHDLELLIQLKIELYQYYNTHINEAISNISKDITIDFKNHSKNIYNLNNSIPFDDKLKSVSYSEIVKNNELYPPFHMHELNLSNTPFSKDFNLDKTNLHFYSFLGFNNNLEHIVENIIISLEKEKDALIDLPQNNQYKLMVEHIINCREIIIGLINTYFKKETYSFLLELTNKIIQISHNQNTNSKINDLIEESETSLDGTTIGTKILFLHKLGVIDFLRKSEPFNMSINKLSAVLSAITDANINSIQPVLNPLISDKEIVNKNNPYYNPKNVKKVEQTLINLGYKLDK